MSMWTGASDELAQYLAQRELEQHRALVDRLALQDRTYQRGRDVITDARATKQDELAALRQKQLDEDRDATRDEVKRTHEYQNASALRQTMQGGAITGGDTPEKQLLDKFNLGSDLYKKIALPVATFHHASRPGAAEGDLPSLDYDHQVNVGPAVQNLGGTEYQAKQRDIAARAEAQRLAEAEKLERQHDSQKFEARQNDLNRQLRAELGATRAGQDDRAPLSDTAVNNAARVYNLSGNLPSLGNGPIAQANKARIMNAAGALDPEADITGNKIALSADRVSLSKARAQADALGQLEETGLRNLDVVLTAAGKIADTGSPLLNKPLRSFQGRVLGAPEQTAFETAHAVLVPELARILGGGGTAGGGVLTDSARHDIEAVISGNATMTQYRAMEKILRTDIANRRASTDHEIGAIESRITARGSRKTDTAAPATTPAADGRGAAPAAKKFNPATGKVE
jgi:hypothetical protein